MSRPARLGGALEIGAVFVAVLCGVCVGGLGRASAQAACTPATFGKEILAQVAGESCPKLDEPELADIVQRIDATAGASELDAVEATARYLAALRELREAYGLRAGWGDGLARGLDAAIAQTRAGEVPLSDFANVRAPNPPVDPAECAFVTGKHNTSTYACVVLEGSPAPAASDAAPRAPVLVLGAYEAVLAWRVLSAAHSAISKLKLPELKRAIERLQQAQRRFDNLRRYGYLQYPWELAIDTALTPRARYQECQTIDTFCSGEAGLDPASVRAIFLHPGVGIAASGLGFKGKPSWDTALALSLEVAGFVAYSDSFETYWGLSAGAIVNDGDFGDTRFGAFIHATRWVHAGYLFSVLRDATRGDASVFVSMDLGTAFGASFLD